MALGHQHTHSNWAQSQAGVSRCGTPSAQPCWLEGWRPQAPPPSWATEPLAVMWELRRRCGNPTGPGQVSLLATSPAKANREVLPTVQLANQEAQHPWGQLCSISWIKIWSQGKTKRPARGWGHGMGTPKLAWLFPNTDLGPLRTALGIGCGTQPRLGAAGSGRRCQAVEALTPSSPGSRHEKEHPGVQAISLGGLLSCLDLAGLGSKKGPEGPAC